MGQRTMANRIEQYDLDNPTIMDQDFGAMIPGDALHLGEAIPRDGSPTTELFAAVEVGPLTIVVYFTPAEARVLAQNLIRGADKIEGTEVAQ